MGKTVPSYRIALEHEISGWREFKKALDIQDQEVFEQLMDAARSYASASGCAVNPIIFEPMVISIMLHQQRKIEKLEKELNTLKEHSKDSEASANSGSA